MKLKDGLKFVFVVTFVVTVSLCVVENIAPGLRAMTCIAGSQDQLTFGGQQNIKKTFDDLSFVIINTPGDGHCVLHATRSSWERQLSQPAPSLHAILCAIFEESISNINI